MNKKANHRGLVHFEIPFDWTCAKEPDGRTACFVPGTETPTLFVDVLEIRKEGSSPDSLSKYFAERASRTSSDGTPKLETLSSGDIWFEHTNRFEEQGTPLVSFGWEIAHFIPPDSARIAIFHLVLKPTELKDDHFRGIVSQLRESAQGSFFPEAAVGWMERLKGCLQ